MNINHYNDFHSPSISGGSDSSLSNSEDVHSHNGLSYDSYYDQEDTQLKFTKPVPHEEQAQEMQL